MNIGFRTFVQSEFVLASCIYGDVFHLTTNAGVVLSEDVRWELGEFLTAYNAFLGLSQTPYYRIDAYFDTEAQQLVILEVNASFVDGWGTALNLARASGFSIDPQLLVFPKYFTTIESVYQPELQLFIGELAQLGLQDHQLVSWDRGITEPIYIYGRVGWENKPNMLPYNGIQLDNKLNLAQFSWEWRGDAVQIPRHYICRAEPWEAVPTEVVLKFCDKNSPECAQARTSVLLGKPTGKAKFLRDCYAAETLLAQARIAPTTYGDKNTQLVIMAIGNNPITGYVQYSEKQIINDNSVHGPLLFE